MSANESIVRRKEESAPELLSNIEFDIFSVDAC